MKKIKRFFCTALASIMLAAVPLAASARFFTAYFDEKRDVAIVVSYTDDGDWEATCYVQGDHMMILCGSDRIDIYL